VGCIFAFLTLNDQTMISLSLSLSLSLFCRSMTRVNARIFVLRAVATPAAAYHRRGATRVQIYIRVLEGGGRRMRGSGMRLIMRGRGRYSARAGAKGPRGRGKNDEEKGHAGEPSAAFVSMSKRYTSLSLSLFLSRVRYRSAMCALAITPGTSLS